MFFGPQAKNLEKLSTLRPSIIVGGLITSRGVVLVVVLLVLVVVLVVLGVVFLVLVAVVACRYFYYH